MRPKVCILRTDGTNCDLETKYAFELAGADGYLVHINQLYQGEEDIGEYQILAIPGGFSYGDDVHSGRLLAVELESFLADKLREFVAAEKAILGIGNGFQVLTQTGLLPGSKNDKAKVALINNEHSTFECRWVRLKIGNSKCIFTKGMENRIIEMQVAHGMGKFFADQDTMLQLEQNNQIVSQYVGEDDLPSMLYPFNPDGSLNSVAGICDLTGRVMGIMYHPERFINEKQYPNWRRGKIAGPHGQSIFKNTVKFASGCK